MKGTWDYWSNHVLGSVEEMTPINEYYVAVYKIQHHLNQGHDEDDIARIWNQGNPSACKAGTNSKGVAFDSCAYEKAVMALLQ